MGDRSYERYLLESFINFDVAYASYAQSVSFFGFLALTLAKYGHLLKKY